MKSSLIPYGFSSILISELCKEYGAEFSGPPTYIKLGTNLFWSYTKAEVEQIMRARGFKDIPFVWDVKIKHDVIVVTNGLDEVFYNVTC